MNTYARLALDHNRLQRPDAYSRIPNPDRFFTTAGEEIQAQITALRDDLLGAQRPDETIDDYRRRGYQALSTAEELVLADHPLFQPETTEEPEEASEDPDLERHLRHLAEINQAINTPL